MYLIIIIKCPKCLENCGFQIQNNEIKPYLNSDIHADEYMVCKTCNLVLERYKLMDSENKEKA